MKINITRPLVFFDLETTGLDIAKDRIVEIAILKIHPNGEEFSYRQLVNPTIPISSRASKIHGYTNQDLKDKPTFSEIAHEVANFIQGCDLAGYNSIKFDIPLLAEEFIRANVEIDLKKRKFIDVQTIFFKMEQRTLKAAYEFYCNKKLVDAHSAEADVTATYEILQSQLDRYDELKNDIDFLSKFTHQTKNADFAGRVIFNDKGEEIFNFGKYKGKPVQQVFEKDHNYYAWIMNGDFPLYTKKILTEIKLRNAFNK